MPRTSKQDAPVLVDEGGFEGRYVELDGYTVGFETTKVNLDITPLFKGLPDDRCQSPHWGTVLSGKLVFRFADHDETYVAGDVYYAPPGHLPVVSAGTEIIEFSPTVELQQTMAVAMQNMAAGVQPVTS
jgi:hypothetical protein